MSKPARILFPFATLLLGASMCAAVSAASFSVDLRHNAVSCTLSGSLLNIDPVTGNVSIDLDSDPTCGTPTSGYPPAIAAMAQSTLAITGTNPAGGGTTGQGDTKVKLSLPGLTGATSGLTCAPDGYDVSAQTLSVVSGWSANLCTNCSASPAERTVTVLNSGNANGTITFKAKCSYTDASTFARPAVTSIASTTVQVQVNYGSTPVTPGSCSSINELDTSTRGGLTAGDWQTTGAASGFINNTGADLTNLVTMFGTYSPLAALYPNGSTDIADLAFPGSWLNNAYVTINKGKYVSFRFRVPTNTNWSGKQGEVRRYPSMGFTGTWAIAPCPGQFKSESAHEMTGACSDTLLNSLFWEVTSGTVTGGYCKLSPGKYYYLNIIAADPSSLATPTCPSSACQATFKHVRLGTYPTSQ